MYVLYCVQHCLLYCVLYCILCCAVLLNSALLSLLRTWGNDAFQKAHEHQEACVPTFDTVCIHTKNLILDVGTLCWILFDLRTCPRCVFFLCQHPFVFLTFLIIVLNLSYDFLTFLMLLICFVYVYHFFLCQTPDILLFFVFFSFSYAKPIVFYFLCFHYFFLCQTAYRFLIISNIFWFIYAKPLIFMWFSLMFLSYKFLLCSLIVTVSRPTDLSPRTVIP